MKLSIAVMSLEPDPKTGIMDVQIREPGIVRHIAWVPMGNLIQTAGRPAFAEKLVAFVEVTAPDEGQSPMHNRIFLVLGPAMKFEPADGHKLYYLGTAASQASGRVAHVYEIKALD